MTDVMPELKPLMLTSLTYGEAKRQMQVTGCAIRRPHWCAPVLIWIDGHVWLDDEVEVWVWGNAAEDKEDMSANDWVMVERPQ